MSWTVAAGSASLDQETEIDMPTRLDRDEELLDALRQRDPTAAERLLITYGDRAYRLATRITGIKEDGEEAVQDAFWAVLRKIDGFRGDCAFGSWLFRIVANAAYQKLRRRNSRRREVPWNDVLPMFDEEGRYVIPMADWSARANDPAVQKELRLALTTAIDKLPADYRTVVVLRDVEGLSTLETAELLGISTSAVKARLHRARLFVRKQLTDAIATMGTRTVLKYKTRSAIA